MSETIDRVLLGMQVSLSFSRPSPCVGVCAILLAEMLLTMRIGYVNDVSQCKVIKRIPPAELIGSILLAILPLVWEV